MTTVVTTLLIDLNGSLESKIVYIEEDEYGEEPGDVIRINYRPSPQFNPRHDPFPKPHETNYYILPEWIPSELPWWDDFTEDFRCFVELLSGIGKSVIHTTSCIYCLSILFLIIVLPILASRSSPWHLFVFFCAPMVVMCVAAFLWPWFWWKCRGRGLLRQMLNKHSRNSYKAKKDTAPLSSSDGGGNARDVHLIMPIDQVAFGCEFLPLTVRLKRRVPTSSLNDNDTAT